MRFLEKSSIINLYKPDVQFSRWIIALLIAVASDVSSFFLSLTVVLQIGMDICTALLLLAVFGWSRALFIALVLEAIPVVSMFPTWTLLIIAMKVSGMFFRKKNKYDADSGSSEVKVV